MATAEGTVKHAVIVFTLALNCGAFASEPLSIKGFRPGLTFEEFQARLPDIKCEDAQIGEPRYCHYHATLQRDAELRLRPYLPRHIPDLQIIAGASADSWMFEFMNDRLEAIRVYFDHSNFEAVVAALIAKSGKPAHASQEILQNRMGARFRSRTYVWRSKDAAFIAQERGIELDTSYIVLEAKTYQADERRRARDSARKRSKDF